jgi:hypothetical protein
MIKEMEQRSPEEIKFPEMASTGEMGIFFIIPSISSQSLAGFFHWGE